MKELKKLQKGQFPLEEQNVSQLIIPKEVEKIFIEKELSQEEKLLQILKGSSVPLDKILSLVPKFRK